MRRQQRDRTCRIEMASHQQGVADRADRVELNADRHVTEREIEVHQADLVPSLADSTAVRLSRWWSCHTALGREYRDDLAPVFGSPRR